LQNQRQSQCFQPNPWLCLVIEGAVINAGIKIDFHNTILPQLFVANIQNADKGLGIVVLSNFDPAVGLCPRGDVGVD
jgi:hypothetical protein